MIGEKEQEWAQCTMAVGRQAPYYYSVQPQHSVDYIAWQLFGKKGARVLGKQQNLPNTATPMLESKPKKEID